MSLTCPSTFVAVSKDIINVYIALKNFYWGKNLHPQLLINERPHIESEIWQVTIGLLNDSHAQMLTFSAARGAFWLGDEEKDWI